VTLWAAALQSCDTTSDHHDDSDSNYNSNSSLNLHTTFTALQSLTAYAQSTALRHSCEPHSWPRPQPPASASLVPAARRPACQQATTPILFQPNPFQPFPKHEPCSPSDNLAYAIPHDCIYTRQLSYQSTGRPTQRIATHLLTSLPTVFANIHSCHGALDGTTPPPSPTTCEHLLQLVFLDLSRTRCRR
jgi:hypothetical protein